MIRIIIFVLGLLTVGTAVSAVADIGFRNKKHNIECHDDSESGK